jgi:hypothetical protein
LHQEKLDHHHHVYTTKCANFGSKAQNPRTNPLLPLLHTLTPENNYNPNKTAKPKKRRL